jgi:uncharacterized protein (DUF1778 family)
MKTEAKETPINLRAKASQRELIDRAAALIAKTRTEFVLDAACREATDILLDQRLILADEAQYNAFVEALESPVTDNEGLKRLLNRKSPWE